MPADGARGARAAELTRRGYMKKYTYQLLAILIASALSSFAAAQDGPRKQLDDLDLRGSDCILIRTIRDYTPLDDRNLLVWGPGKRGYFVTLIRPAFGMRSSFRLGFSSRDDQLCPFGGDAIVFGDGPHEQVRVRSISRVDKEQAEELMIRFGKKEPAENPTPDPARVEGAEVEELG